MKKDYRPTVLDFTPHAPQSLSCKEAGEFDTKFHLSVKDGKVTGRRVTTQWQMVCLDRVNRGVSRQNRIHKTGAFAGTV